MQSHNKDYYRILGIPRSASQKQIDKAYCKLSVQWHPSNHEDSQEEAQERFNEISEAYNTLSNRSRRSAYDKSLKSKSSNKRKESSEDQHGEDKHREDQSREDKHSGGFFKFFDDWSPFPSFDKDFFSGDWLGLKKGSKESAKSPKESSRKRSSAEETVHSDEEYDESPKQSPKQSYYRQLHSTSSSTVIKNGERVTKTKKTIISPDGTKKVKIIEEKEDKDGNVNRTVKCLKNGKEVDHYQKQITAGEEEPELKKSKSCSQVGKSSKKKSYP